MFCCIFICKALTNMLPFFSLKRQYLWKSRWKELNPELEFPRPQGIALWQMDTKHEACKMCSNYPGVKLIRAFWRLEEENGKFEVKHPSHPNICKTGHFTPWLVPEAKERLLTSRRRFVVCRLLQKEEIRRSKLFVFVAGKVLSNLHEFASLLQLAVRTRYHPQQRVLNFVDQSNNL